MTANHNKLDVNYLQASRDSELWSYNEVDISEIDESVSKVLFLLIYHLPKTGYILKGFNYLIC